MHGRDISYHSCSETDEVSAAAAGTSSLVSASPSTGPFGSLVTSDTAVNCFNRSLASALRSAGFFSFRARAGSGIAALR